MKLLALAIFLVGPFMASAQDISLIPYLKTSQLDRDQITFVVFRQRELLGEEYHSLLNISQTDFDDFWTALSRANFLGTVDWNSEEPWILFTIHGAHHSKMQPYETLLLKPDGGLFLLLQSNSPPRKAYHFSAPELYNFAVTFMKDDATRNNEVNKRKDSTEQGAAANP